MNIKKGLTKIAGWQRFLPMFIIPIIMSACPDSPTNPKDENPYKQEPIDWPSLADSPWPMYHGGPLGNGLSFQSGPANRTIKWKVDITDIGTGVVVDDSGNVYVSSFSGDLYKINSIGEIVWKKSLVDYYVDDSGTPILLNNGNIFMHFATKGFIVNGSGNILTSFDLPAKVWSQSFQIDMPGNLYSVTEDRQLFKITQNGDLLWSITPPDSLDDQFLMYFIPVFVNDGSELIVTGQKNVYAIDLNGHIIWYYPTTIGAPPIITSNDEIFIYHSEDSTLNSIDKAGNLNFQTKVENGINIEPISRPTITSEGDIVYPTFSPVGAVKFSAEGELIWQTTLPEGSYVCSELITDIDGNIYISTWHGGFYILSYNGEILSEIGSDLIVEMSPAISDGVLYFGDQNRTNGGLYAIE